MKFITSLIRKILYVFALIFFVAIAFFNSKFVAINLFGLKTLEMPLFLIIFASFIIGSFFSFLHFLFSKK